MNDLEKSIRSQIDATELWKHVVKLSAIDRTGGSPGEREAVKYVMTKLAEYGVRADLHEFECLISLPIEAEFEILEPTRLRINCSARGFAASTSKKGIEAEIVFVPSAADSGDKAGMIFSKTGGLDDYANINVAGKIVLSTTGGVDGVKNAQEAGVVAHCHMWPSGENIIHEYDISPIWGTPTPETAPYMPKIPAIGITRGDGEKIKSLLSKGKVHARLKTKLSTKFIPVQLPVATVEGSKEAGRFQLVGGHLCSWGHGVTDNATGVACLLELARVLNRNKNQLRRSVRLAWWTAHEQGHYGGSTWYADNAFSDLRHNCVGVMNIDSPGVRGAAVWDCRFVHGEVEKFLGTTVREVTGQAPNPRRPFKAGDHTFLGIGIPSMGAFQMLPVDSSDRALVGGSGGGWWWQSPADTIDKADRGILSSHANLYLTIIWRLCTAEQLPYEFITAAKDYQRLLGELSQSGGGHIDLGPAIHAADAFHAVAKEVEEVRGKVSAAVVERLNAGLMAVGRAINPVLYTIAGEYDQDLALQLPMLPGLQGIRKLSSISPDSNEYRFLKTRLIRERNRTEEALLRGTLELKKLAKDMR